MKQFLYLLIFSLCFFSCEKKQVSKLENGVFENYNLSISTLYYNYDLKSGEFIIRGYAFVDNISLTKTQKNKIAKAFFQFNIDTLKGEKNVLLEIPIMPDSRKEIKINIENYQKSKLNISDQVNEESELNKAEYNIFKFNEKLFEILNENADYKNCMDTLEVAIKKLPPLL